METAALGTQRRAPRPAGACRWLSAGARRGPSRRRGAGRSGLIRCLTENCFLSAVLLPRAHLGRLGKTNRRTGGCTLRRLGRALRCQEGGSERDGQAKKTRSPGRSVCHIVSPGLSVRWTPARTPGGTCFAVSVWSARAVAFFVARHPGHTVLPKAMGSRRLLIKMCGEFTGEKDGGTVSLGRLPFGLVTVEITHSGPDFITFDLVMGTSVALRLERTLTRRCTFQAEQSVASLRREHGRAARCDL